MFYLKVITLYITSFLYLDNLCIKEVFKHLNLISKQPRSIFLNNDSIVVTFTQLQELLPKAKEGTVFLIKNGVYSDIDIIITKNNNKLVSIKPQTPGQVIIEGKSRLLIRNSRKLKLSGFLFRKTKLQSCIVLSNSTTIEVFDNYFEKCGANKYGSLIQIVNGSKSNYIYNNTFEQNRSMGIVIALSSLKDTANINNLIHHNFFHNIPSVNSLYPGESVNGLEAIQLGQGDYGSTWQLNTRIYNNLFEDIVGDGSEIISVKTSNTDIYNNTFLNNKSGITIRSGNNCNIFDNYFKHTTQGIRIFGFGHTIKNNYFYESNFAFQLPATNFYNGDPILFGGYNQQENIEITNNVIENPLAAAFRLGTFASSFNKRTLMPKNVTVSSNVIFIKNKGAVDFKIDFNSVLTNIDILDNTIYIPYKNKNDRKFDASNSFKTSIGIKKPLFSYRFFKYDSMDPRVGVRWKKLI